MKGKRSDYENNFNLYEYFRQKTLANASKNAIFYQDKIVTFKKLNEQTIKINNFLYERLKKLMVNLDEKNDSSSNRIVAIHLNPDELTIPVLMAIHSLSLSYLPIDPQLPIERMEYILNDSKPACIITNIPTNEKLKLIIEKFEVEKHGIKVINLNDVFEKSDDAKNVNPLVIKVFSNIKNYDPRDYACVLYTSGSTGPPKGVCLSHYTIMNRLNWQWQTFHICENNQDIGAFKTSLNFVDHICEIFAFILRGLPLVVFDNETLLRTDRLIEKLHEYKITYFVLVPSLLRNILLYVKLKETTNKLNSIRRWVCSGEALNVDLLDLFFEVFEKNDESNIPMLSNFYGSTEVTADATYVSFTSREQTRSILFEKNNVPIGEPIANTNITLFDENMNEINCDFTVGEIFISGFCLASGYLNDHKNKSNKFVLFPDGRKMFKTGDYGFICNSLLYFSGRNDSQLKIRGKRVNLNELEYYSTLIEGIQSFVPLIYELENDNKIIIAYYKSSMNMLNESEINKTIVESLKKNIFDFMIPSYLMKIDEIPLLYNGKIDKQYLKKLFLNKYLPQKIDVNEANKNEQNVQDLKMENEIMLDIQNMTGIYFNKFNEANNSDCSYLNLKLNEIGINSLNATLVYLSIENINKYMKFEEFLSSHSLSDLLKKLKLKKLESNEESNNDIELNKLHADIFNDLSLSLNKMSHLKAMPFAENENFATMVLKMMVDTFTKKSVIHSLYPEYQDDLFNFYSPTAELLKHSNESFIVYDTIKKKYVGGTYIYDYSVIPQVEIKNEYYKSFVELLGSNKRIIATNLSTSKLLNATFLTTNIEATYMENIHLVNFIEDQIISIAKNFGYDTIITVNTNRLTRDLAINFKGYTLEKEVQINKYLNSSGNAFFSRIPDSYKLSVCVKRLTS